VKAIDTQPRSLVAYEIALRLIYHAPPTASWNASPVRAAQLTVDHLRMQGKIPESEHRQLTSLLNGFRYSDTDQDDRLNELVAEISLTLTVSQEDFPTERLVKLRGLL